MGNRRDFLRSTGFVTAGTLLLPRFLHAADHIKGTDRKLVVIQLSGGNDGLNTVIPYRNDIYYSKRPKLSIGRHEVIPLTDEMGLNPSMSGLRDLYEQGYLTIYNNVGYPNPNRSHFRSMDIWQTGLPSEEYGTTGWLGRYLDHSCEVCSPAAAIELDNTLSLAMKGSEMKGLAVDDPGRFYRSVQDRQIGNIAGLGSKGTGTDLDYLYKILTDVQSSASYIQKYYRTGENNATYPDNAFAKDLRSIARLINSGIDTRIFYVSLTGFDTHANQMNRQAKLLATYSESVTALVEDLRQSGEFQNTLILTFSEFGRRVNENGSGGTDHGKANNVFLIGGSLKRAGVVNQPDLGELDEGDLAFETDFRQIYSTILQKWLNQDPRDIMKGSFGMLDFV